MDILGDQNMAGECYNIAMQQFAELKSPTDDQAKNWQLKEGPPGEVKKNIRKQS